LSYIMSTRLRRRTMNMCITISGKTYCFRFPFFAPPMLWWPWEEVKWPWGELDPANPIDNGIGPRVSRDMTTLAIINQLSKQLSPGLQDSVSGGVKAAAEQLALPEGITVGF
jgi:hypothetical protein